MKPPRAPPAIVALFLVALAASVPGKDIALALLLVT